MHNGPREQAIRDTLGSRLAGVLDALPMNAQNCFAGLFNGARQGSIGLNDRLFVGKAECEWDWRETWQCLKDAGLLEWSEYVVDAPGAVGGKMTEVHWHITEKGFDVRDDDLEWFNALLAARAEDEKAT